MSAPALHLVRWFGFPYLPGRKVSRLLLTALALQDWALLLLLGRTRPAPAPPLEKKRIVVAKLDHLGDVLMITPFLRELRAQAPSCTVDLLIGSWCREAGEILRDEGLCDGFFFYDAVNLNKGSAGRIGKTLHWLRTFREAVRRLRGADAYIDLRAFTPNAVVAARLAGVPYRAGFGLRGGSFLLHQQLDYAPETPLGQLYLDVLPRLGLRGAVYEGPVLPRWEKAPAGAIRAALPSRYAAIHPFSRDALRMAGDDLWVGFAERLSRHIPLVVLGAKADAEQPLAALLAALPGVTVLAGRTTFREAAECVRHAEAFAGVDSVFAHVALAFGRPAFLFFLEGTSQRASFPARNPLLRLASADGVDAEALARAFLEFAPLP